MPRRMSNRDRIERMRAEADATERERVEARPGKREGTPRRRAAASGPVRMMAVWAIKNGAGEIVKTYPYPRKDLAEAEVRRLREAGQSGCIVCPHRVPLE